MNDKDRAADMQSEDKYRKRHKMFAQILKEELLPAMGCTEPIAIAYAAAVAAKTLGKRPDEMIIEVSGNIIKKFYLFCPEFVEI